MGVDEIITLDDGKEFVLLSDVYENGERYFMACEVVNDEPVEHFEIFKQVVENGELLVEEVEDDALKNKLLILFQDNYDLDEEEADL